MARFEKQLDDWVSNNLISRDQASAIRQFEANVPASSWVLYSFLILGASIIGIGVISVIAANWDTIPDAVKLGVDFLILIGLVAGICHCWNKKQSIQFEVLLVLFLFLCLASIGLISQIYHTGGRLYQALMFWSLITVGVPIVSQRTFGPFLWVSGFMIALIYTLIDSPSFGPIFEGNITAVFMMVPLLSAVLSMVSKKYLGDVGLTRSFKAWTVIGILLGLFFVEINFNRYSSSLGYAVTGFPAYLPGYLLAATVLLKITFTSEYTRPQKILLAVLIGFYFIPFHLIFVAKDADVVFAFCTLVVLGLLAVFLASLKKQKLFQFLLFVMGLRFLILYFQALGGLAATGFGLILSGGLIIAMVVYWNKYRRQMAAWSEGLLK